MAEINQAKFGDNILTIDKGVYGEDVRMAIKENIIINNQLIGTLNANITTLNDRVDALVDSGGGGDDPGPNPGPTVIGGVVSGETFVVLDALAETDDVSSGEAIEI